MRAGFVVAALLFAGCGSRLDPLPAPEHTEHTIVDGGTSHVQPVTTPEPMTSCTLQVYDPISGVAYTARRELVDAKGRPRQRSNGSLFDSYVYDGDRLVSAPPYSYVYEDTLLEQYNGGPSPIGYYRLDAHDRMVGQLSGPTGEPYNAYAYDDAGRVVSQTDSGGGVHSWTYDERGFLASEDANWSGGGSLCHRTWVWEHGDMEVVTVSDGTRAIQSCRYTFDAMDRLTSARCRYSTALWSYDGNTAIMTLSQSGSLTNVERFAGACDTPTRANLPHVSEPVAYDPRPSKLQLRRLAATPVPAPSQDCMFFGPGPEEGKL